MNDKYTLQMPHSIEFSDYAISNYSKWLYSICKQYLGKKIFELGSGTGKFSRFLSEENAESLLLLEPSSVFFEELKKNMENKKNILLVNSDIEKFENPKLKSFFDSVISIQVFEHIEDDEAALEKAAQYLRPGGKIIIQVPALNWLYSKFDKQIGHFRRYTKKDAFRLAKACGLKINKLFYFNLPGIFGWWLNFCIFRRDFSKSLNSDKLMRQGHLFDKYFVPVIRSTESLIHPPIGLGLQMVFEKVSDT